MDGLLARFLPVYAAGTVATLGAGWGVFALALRRGWRVPRLLPWAAVPLLAFPLAAQLLKLEACRDYLDFTVWNEVVHNIAGGRGAWSSLQERTIPGTGNWLSTHFTPLIYLFAVPYRLAPGPRTLLVCQYLLLLAPVPLLWLYARRRLGAGMAGAVAAAFVLFPTYHYIHLYEFEFLRFCIPVLLLAYRFLEEGRLRWYWPCLVLALLVREEVALTTFLLGLHAAVFLPGRRRTGVATALLSIAYFMVVTAWVMPAFRTGAGGAHVASHWFEEVGGTPKEMLLTLLTRPWVPLAVACRPEKLASVAMLVLPLICIPLRAWGVLAICGANVGLNLLSGSPTHTSYFLYYLSPSIPFVFLALVRGLELLSARLRRPGEEGLPPGRTRGGEALACGLLAGALAAHVAFGPTPLSLQFWCRGYELAPFRTLSFHWSNYQVTEHHRLARKVLGAVPPDAVVSAEQSLLPLLHDRRGLQVFPDLGGAGYVAIDKKNPLKAGVSTVPGSWDGLREDPQRYYDLLEKDPATWEVAAAEDGYVVFRRKAAAGEGGR
jgi:hypothetical protein